MLNHYNSTMGSVTQHINAVLEKMMGPQNVNYPACAILSVSINDVNNNTGSTMTPAMRTLAQRPNKQFPKSRVVIPRSNCPAHLGKVEKVNMGALNHSLS